MLSLNLKGRWQGLLDGNLTDFDGPTIPAGAAGRLRAEQLDSISRYTLAMMSANVFAAIGLATIMLRAPYAGITFAWAFALITLAVYVYLRRRDAAARVWRTRSVAAVRRVSLYALALGMLWAFPPAALFADASRDLQILLACMSIAVICAGALALSALPIAALAFVMPICTGACVGFVSAGERIYVGLAALLALYSLMLLRAIATHACQLTRRFLARIAGEEATNADGLTHLPNANAYRASLESALMRAHRYGENFAMVLFGIDHLGAINRQYGVSTGDDLLVQAANRLKSCTREADVLARLDEDRFALLAWQIDTPEQAVTLAERAIRTFASPFAVAGRQEHVSVTGGIVLVPADGRSVDVLLQKAQAALARGKTEQRGGAVFFEKRHEEQAREERSLATDLRKALKGGEFSLVYQPVFSIAERRITGCEALLRWNHPVRGQVSPTQFVPLAESLGLIQDIGEWVIAEALRTASTWTQDIRIAINVSALQFRTADLVNALKRAIQETGIASSRVEIEITETSLMGDSDAVIDILNQVRELGTTVALDDFGTGYSSLTYLSRLPLDRLKIDRSFVQRAPHSAKAAILLRTVCSLAHELGMQITGEGVETNAHLGSLVANHADEVQGFLLGRPMPAAEIAEELRRADQHTSLVAPALSAA